MPLDQIADEGYTITADIDILLPDNFSLCPNNLFQFSDDNSTCLDDDNGEGHMDSLQLTFESNKRQLMTLDLREAAKVINSDLHISNDEIDQ
jgi:hypothetical protein